MQQAATAVARGFGADSMTPGLGNRYGASCWAWETRNSPCRKRVSSSCWFVLVWSVSQPLADQMQTKWAARVCGGLRSFSGAVNRVRQITSEVLEAFNVCLGEAPVRRDTYQQRW